jgi:hypothetical protein
MKIPLFMYEVTSKQAKKNLQSFLTQLNFFEELNQKKYPEATPILSRVTSSLGDKDNSERCFQKMLEEKSSKLRKDTELEEIAGWVHGTCFQHNLDGNIFIYFFFLVKVEQQCLLGNDVGFLNGGQCLLAGGEEVSES